MNIFDISTPYVLECYYFYSHSTALNQHKRIVSNYELDLNLNEGRIMTVNDKTYTLEKNSLVFRKPGEFVESGGTYKMYLLTFTFDESIKNYSRNVSNQKPYPFDIELLKHMPTYIKPKHTGEITEIYKQLLSNYGVETSKDVCSKLVTRLIYLLAAESVNMNISSCLPYPSEVNRAIAYISEHYSEPITLDMIADSVNLDKSYMIRLFKKSTGKTPIEYLIEKRISIAKSLLDETDLNISEVSAFCGFLDSSYFTLRFRSAVGMTPTKYKKQSIRNQNNQ